MKQEAISTTKEKKDKIKILREQALEQGAEIDKIRNERISLENEILADDPEQRVADILDYFRRGKNKDGQEFQPEMITALPNILKAGIFNLSKEKNSQEIIGNISQAFKDFENEIAATDKKIRGFLEARNITAPDDAFLDKDWYKKLINELESYRRSADKPIHPSNPLFNQPDEHRNKQREKCIKKLGSLISGDISALIDDYVGNRDEFKDDFLNPGPVISIHHHALQKEIGNSLRKIPKLSGYGGDFIQEPPPLTSQKIKNEIKVITRGELPDARGGIMIDGNFGYDTDGELIAPDDKLIIDHHDKLDEGTYDTATIMAGRLWQGKERGKINLRGVRSGLKAYENEKGKITTMINHLDSDSVLSLWALRNPAKANKHKELIGKISFAGDFLLGTGEMEHGVTARDYNYIIENYLEACREKIRNERTAVIEKLIQAKEKKLQEISALKKADPELNKISQEIDSIGRDKSIQGSEKGKMIGALKAKMQEKERGIFGALSREIEGIDRELAAAGVNLKNIDKSLDQLRQKKITDEENTKILMHLISPPKSAAGNGKADTQAALSPIEEMITQPFKYKKYLEMGRNKEEATIAKVREDYESGAIEITPDPEDSDLLVISPLKAKNIPRYESIDGLYFYLRNRSDFNKKLVMQLDGDSYSLAINTQNMKGLKEFDFNILIDELKTLEDSYIVEAISEAGKKISAAGDEKETAALNKQLSQLELDREKNRQGLLWRNRTQMVFCFKSHMPQKKFKEIVHRWKNEQQEQVLGRAVK